MAQMLPGFIVGLREGLEAFLIISLILDYVRKLHKNELAKAVVYGMYAGIVVSAFLGLGLWLLSILLSGMSSAIGKVWEAGASLTAAVFISYFIYWMIKHGRSIVSDVQSSVDLNLSYRGLFILALIAVAREGVEIALFTFTSNDGLVYFSGNMIGIIAAAVLAYLMYRSLLKINVGVIFRITLLYLILQAAYLSGYAVHELLSSLKEIGVLSGEGFLYMKLFSAAGTIFDHKTGPLGIALNVLIGWYSRPEIIQAAVQTLYIAVFGGIWYRENYGRSS